MTVDRTLYPPDLPDDEASQRTWDVCLVAARAVVAGGFATNADQSIEALSDAIAQLPHLESGAVITGVLGSVSMIAGMAVSMVRALYYQDDPPGFDEVLDDIESTMRRSEYP